MTDSQKLDLLLEKVIGIEKDVIEIKADVSKLHRNDILILDEVERVHDILSKHVSDKSKHSA